MKLCTLLDPLATELSKNIHELYRTRTLVLSSIVDIDLCPNSDRLVDDALRIGRRILYLWQFYTHHQSTQTGHLQYFLQLLSVGHSLVFANGTVCRIGWAVKGFVQGC